MTSAEALAMVEAAARGGGADLEEPLRRAMLRVVHLCKTSCREVAALSSDDTRALMMNTALHAAVPTLARVEEYLVTAERAASTKPNGDLVLLALAPLAVLVLDLQHPARRAYDRAMREILLHRR